MWRQQQHWWWWVWFCYGGIDCVECGGVRIDVLNRCAGNGGLFGVMVVVFRMVRYVLVW